MANETESQYQNEMVLGASSLSSCIPYPDSCIVNPVSPILNPVSPILIPLPWPPAQPATSYMIQGKGYGIHDAGTLAP
jgi:hypothetical protein